MNPGNLPQSDSSGLADESLSWLWAALDSFPASPLCSSGRTQGTRVFTQAALTMRAFADESLSWLWAALDSFPASPLCSSERNTRNASIYSSGLDDEGIWRWEPFLTLSRPRLLSREPTMLQRKKHKEREYLLKRPWRWGRFTFLTPFPLVIFLRETKIRGMRIDLPHWQHKPFLTLRRSVSSLDAAWGCVTCSSEPLSLLP